MVNTSMRTTAQPTGHDQPVIFHIAQRDRWLRSLADGEYTVSTIGLELADVGFIHFCTTAQAAGVAERFYCGVTDLVLLHVDESRLTAPLTYEHVGDVPDAFPHLYGALNVDAVVHVDDPFIA